MSPARCLEAVLFVGVGATVIHTALAVATRPVDETPAAALMGGISDAVGAAEVALLFVTAAARLAAAVVSANRAARSIPRPVAVARTATRRRSSWVAPSPGDYRSAIEAAVFGPAGPIRGEVPGR